MVEFVAPKAMDKILVPTATILTWASVWETVRMQRQPHEVLQPGPTLDDTPQKEVACKLIRNWMGLLFSRQFLHHLIGSALQVMHESHGVYFMTTGGSTSSFQQQV